MIRILIPFLLSLLTLLWATSSYGQLHTFKNLNHRDGLHMASIRVVNQSEDGYLWIGTDGAEIIRYDGESFEEIDFAIGDNNHHVENISFSGNDILFASRYKGFFQFSRKDRALIRLNDKSIKHGEALGTYKKGGYYYFIGTRAIFRRKGNQFKELLVKQSDERGILPTQIIETKEAIFVLTENGGYRLSDGKIIELSKWLGNSSIANINDFQFGYVNGDKVTLTNKKANRWLDIVLNETGELYSINEITSVDIMSETEELVSISYNEKAKTGGILTSENIIHRIENGKIKIVAHNYHTSLSEAVNILTDVYGDFWLSSDIKGIYKVSREPFTKLDLHPIYSSADIALPYRTEYGDIFVSFYKNETHVGNLYNSKPFRKYDFTIRAVQKVGETYYIATNTGIRIYHPETHPNFDLYEFKNQNVPSILVDGTTLWVGVAGKGLYTIDTENHAVKKVESDKIPQYVYCGQVSPDGKELYFGTNNGVFKYLKKTNAFERLPTPGELGSYSGVATKDKFGTSWFTMEKGIIGITKDKKLKVVNDPQYFESTLFYTLCSDTRGNLIIGTNKGITILKVDKSGNVENRTHYDDKSGFLGYETNMRSQYENGDDIYIGTIEGLFLLNTAMLEDRKTPLPPIITHHRAGSLLDQNEETHPLSFEFKVNHPKTGAIKYLYRIYGAESSWIKLGEKINTIQLHGLSNGNYTLEVKATYDGINFSESTNYSFSVNLPIWKSNWFIILMSLAILVFNIIVLTYYKPFDSGKFMNTKDIVVHLRMAPMILLFATIATPATQLLGPFLLPDLNLKLGLSLAVGFSLLTLYFLSLSAKANGKQYLFDTYLKIGFIIVMSDYMWEVYASHLHPFNIIGVILISTVAPYILGKIRTTIIFGLIMLSLSICFVSILDHTMYSKVYFIIAMFIMVIMTVFASYLRYDSLEKLIFISAIINKGNIPAIAFDKDGVVTYCSENISNFAAISHEEIIGANISVLNRFVPFGENFKNKDITKEFVDGEKYLTPMQNIDGEVHWMEWAYRDFSKNIRVVLGQDITEKMVLENTYELLVQNAEDFIYRCDIDGNFVFLNDICYSKLGYTKEDLIGTLSTDIIQKDYRKDAEVYYAEHFEQNLTSSYKEFPIVNKRGELVWIGQYVTTLYSAGSNSHISGFIALARDITEIREQQELIKEQRDAITSSINYARRIQYNLLPNENGFVDSFNEHFIISKPKDIVSGDFYWMQKVRNHTVLVVADCTGHGVPGSFMTLLGFNLLNGAVLENGMVDPSTILNELDKKLKEYLPKGEGKNAVNDGMEVTICVFNDATNELAYACAGSRFLVFENGEFTMFKGDNKHIGDIEESFGGYNTHHANFASEYSLFLFSDGFQDQFGGPKDKKYSFRRLLELFESNIHLPLNEQQKMIEADFDQWIGDTSQTDDVTVISVKPKFK